MTMTTATGRVYSTAPKSDPEIPVGITSCSCHRILRRQTPPPGGWTDEQRAEWLFHSGNCSIARLERVRGPQTDRRRKEEAQRHFEDDQRRGIRPVKQQRKRQHRSR